VVIAQSFARIFRQNMFNCGMLAIDLSQDKIASLFEFCKQGEAQASVDIETSTIQVESSGRSLTLLFNISEFDKALVRSGGWVEYADENY
jgi:3-isopropylmalate/(R)-2-methylmalate dehydratase small subunit